MFRRNRFSTDIYNLHYLDIKHIESKESEISGGFLLIMGGFSLVGLQKCIEI